MSLNVVNPFKNIPVEFQPTDISDLRFWWDATDESTIDKIADRVSEWRDKSGNSQDLVQATAGAQPLFIPNDRNNNNVIDFAGNRFMRSNFVTGYNYPVTLIYVSELSGNNGLSQIMFYPFNTTASNVGWRKNATADQFALVADGTSITFTKVGIANTWRYVTLIYNGASSSARVDGVQEGAGAINNGSSPPITVGEHATGGQFADNKVMHILAYEKILSAQELIDIETWANDQINP